MRGTTKSRALWLSACLALSACTLLNAPEDLPRAPFDAGVDGFVGDSGGGEVDMTIDEDGGVDAGVDAGSDAGPSCRSREICFNGDEADDDCDGATDCDDLDCAGNAACCAGGASRLSENWSTALGVRWEVANPASDLGAGALSVDGALSFGVDGRLRSMLPFDALERCLPLSLGARIVAEFARTSCADADGGACSGEAAVLLTASDTPASGRALAADLRVSVGSDRLLRVTSGATELLRPAVAVGDSRRVVIDVSPVARDGVPLLAARVSVGAAGMESEVLADAVFVRQDELRACPVDAGGTTTAGGLRFAVEGRGPAIELGSLDATTLACTNPVVFTTVGDAITATHLPAESDWNRGGIGAPALLSGSTSQRLLYDATNVDRDLEDVAPIDFSVGMADGASFRIPRWVSRPTPGDTPPAYLGTTPPTCTAAACTSPITYREPTGSATWGPTGQLTDDASLLAFARETPLGRYEIAYVDVLSRTDASPGASPSLTTTLVTPGAGCVSVRDPAFAQADREPASGLWLFYTCEPSTGPSTIRAVALASSGAVWSARAETDVEVLGPSIGAYAARGVRGAAPIVRVLPDAAPGSMGGTLAVRLWFVARGADGRATLGLAEGQRRLAVRGTAPSEALPTLLPSAANPLLDGASPTLGACPENCALEDVAVGRIPGAGATRVTLLLARRVDEPGGGTVRQFVPLEQTLEPRWWGNP
jgi:hypothetical protein